MSTSTAERHDHASTTAFSILAAISFCHLLNDMMQSLLPSIYPILKANYALDFGQIGLITFTFQFTASLLQPVIGYLTDRWPQPYSLVVGMGFSLIGLLLLASAASYPGLLVAAALVGSGSAVLHPESSRVARMAAGSQPGLAQAVFQLGGNLGSSLGPLFAAGIVLRNGQSSVAWFGIAAVTAMILLARVGHWYKAHGLARMRSHAARSGARLSCRDGKVRVLGRRARRADLLEVLLHGEHVELLHLLSNRPIRRARCGRRRSCCSCFWRRWRLAPWLGGKLGDRFGRKFVIWASILGVLPFTLALPYANLFWTGVLTVPIGLILASAFPAIVVYGQELMPLKVGTVAGLFFGLAFGLGGTGAALIGQFADATSIQFVFKACSFLPLLGLLAALLPHIETGSGRRALRAAGVDAAGPVDAAGRRPNG